MSGQTDSTEIGAEETETNENQPNTDQDSTSVIEEITPLAISRDRRATIDVGYAKKQMDEAVSVLKTISQRSNCETSEADLFCKLLATKLKSFHQEEMEDIMHKIDERIYCKRLIKSKKHTPTAPIIVTVPAASPSPTSQSQFPILSCTNTTGLSTKHVYCTMQSSRWQCNRTKFRNYLK